jgi:hypothetical protein
VTLGPLALLSVLCAPLVLGAGLLRLAGIGWRADRVGYAAWCALAGGLGTGALLLGWAWLGWPFDARLVAPAVVALGVLGLVLGARMHGTARPSSAADGARACPAWERALFAASIGLALVVGLFALVLSLLTGFGGGGRWSSGPRHGGWTTGGWGGGGSRSGGGGFGGGGGSFGGGGASGRW